MKVRITKLNVRENLQTNLRNIAIGERSCNSVKKHKLVSLTMGTPCKSSNSEKTEPKRLRSSVGIDNPRRCKKQGSLGFIPSGPVTRPWILSCCLLCLVTSISIEEPSLLFNRILSLQSIFFTLYWVSFSSSTAMGF